MGRYVGYVDTLPSRNRLGRIRSTAFANPVQFDIGSLNAVGNIVEGSVVSFELRSSGTAYKLKRSVSKNYKAMTRKRSSASPAGS